MRNELYKNHNELYHAADDLTNALSDGNVCLEDEEAEIIVQVIYSLRHDSDLTQKVKQLTKDFDMDQVIAADDEKKFQAYLYDNLAHDDRNPRYLFAQTSTDLLLAIIDGHIDAVALIKDELANRAVDQKGKWVGFKQADKIWV